MTVVESPSHILVIDDDALLQASVKEFFTSYDFVVSALPDGKGIESALAALEPDIVLLDVMIPGEDGFAILRRVRAVSPVPVIMISACGENVDRILGLEQGADDYMNKPFHPRELLARVRAVLRRTAFEGIKNRPEKVLLKGVLTTGSVTLDCDHQMLKRGDLGKALSTAEFAVIHTFMKHAGKVLTREEILSQAFGSDYFVSDRSIDVHINRLRKILRDLGDKEIRIRTVWGKGYSWISED